MLTRPSFRLAFIAAIALSCLLLFRPAGAPAARAQGTAESILYVFDDNTADDHGCFPYANVIQAPSGVYYGTTDEGGSKNDGIVYTVTTSGTVKTLHNFGDGSVKDDGVNPLTPLVADGSGNLYGTTTGGGADGDGTVFKITSSGTETILHSFTGGADSGNPESALSFGNDGRLYGTTIGLNDKGTAAYGTVFSLNTDGSDYLVQFRFNSDNGPVDGEEPASALTPVLASGTALYGTAFVGGSGQAGTIFELTPGTTDGSGKFILLHSFQDGSVTNDGGGVLFGSLLLDAAGNLYGTTEFGGANGVGTVFKLSVSSKTETILYSFAGTGDNDDGVYASGGVTLGTDGQFYGTTREGGDYGYGNVYVVNTSGGEQELYGFGDNSEDEDGFSPFAAPVEEHDGSFFGTTQQQSPFANTQDGTIYHVTTDLPAPAAVSKLALNASSVVGGSANATGTVTLSKAATAGGVAVSLRSSNSAAATVPASIIIPANATSGTFTITSHAVSSNTSTEITTFYTGTSASESLTVTSGTSSKPSLSSASVSPTSTTAGSGCIGTVQLSADAPSGGIVVSLASSDTSAVTVPSSVTVASGDNTESFAVATKAVTKATTVTITATYSGVSKTASLTVNPATGSLKSVTLNPASLVGGASSTASRVYLNGDAKAAMTVTLKSSDTSVATVPSSVTISSGSSSHTFTITTKAVTSSTTVTITATAGGLTTSATLTVTPVTSTGLKSVTLDPTSTTGGSSTTANRVYWNGNAPVNETVTLTSSNTSVATVPSTVTIGSGSSSHTFTVTTKSVTTSTNVTITASAGGVKQTATLTVLPTSQEVREVLVSPASTMGGSATTANRVYLNGDALANTTVTLTSSDTSVATVPPTMTIDSGSSSHTFTITTNSVTASTKVTITATANGTTQAATLTVTP